MKKVITIILLSCLLIITGCSKKQKGNPLVGIWYYEDPSMPIKRELYLDCDYRFYESGINYPFENFETSGTYELVDAKVNLYSDGELYQIYSYQEHSKEGKTQYYFYDGTWENPDHRFSGQNKTCKEMKALIDEKLAIDKEEFEEYIGTYKNNQGKVITISKDSNGNIKIDKQVIHKLEKKQSFVYPVI